MNLNGKCFKVFYFKYGKIHESKYIIFCVGLIIKLFKFKIKIFK